MTQEQDTGESKGFNIPLWLGAGVPAVAAFLLSRGKYKPLLGKAVADRIKRHGVARGVIGLDEAKIKNDKIRKLYNYLQFGTSETQNIQKLRKAPKDIKDKLFWGTEHEAGKDFKFKQSIGVSPRPGSYDKAEEYTRLLSADPKLTEGFVSIGEEMAKLKHISNPAKRLAALQNVLNNHALFKGRGYIIKGRSESATIGSPLLHTDDLSKMYRSLKNKSMQLPAKVQKLAPDEQMHWIRSKVLMGTYRMQDLLNNPDKLIAQRLLDIKKLSPSQEYANKSLNAMLGRLGVNVSTIPEYRVHVINGKVVPGTTVAKHLPISAFTGINPYGAGKVERAAQRMVNTLMKKDPSFVDKQTFGLDIAPVRGGGFKLIETNPEAYSGYLNPYFGAKVFDPAAAIRSHKTVSKLMGQDTYALSGLKGLTAGLAGAAMTPVVNYAINKTAE